MSLTALIFIVGFAVGCGLALFRHPIYGLLVYVAALYFDPSGQWWGQGALQSIRWEFVPAALTLVAMYIHRRKLPPSPAFRSAAFWGFVAFVAWIAFQSLWALDPASNRELLTIWAKYVVAAIMVCGCIDSWKHLRLFLWAQVIGCLYLGWLAYTSYTGGRFEGFGAGSLGEANAGALQLVLGLIVGAALFLEGSWRTRAVLLLPLAIIADGIVTTVSRSGFLAAAASLLGYNYFTPRKLRARVVMLSALAVVCFLSLTTASYWNRMQTIEYEGADVQGVDTGGGRLDIIRAQWKMFELYPFGCGAMCTTVLSPRFIDARFLTGGQRASHNTFMSMLVDHGIPGGTLYILLLLWTYSTLRKAAKLSLHSNSFAEAVLPALAAGMIAIIVGDLFVQHQQLEARVWFVCLLISYMRLLEQDAAAIRERERSAPISTSRTPVGAQISNS